MVIPALTPVNPRVTKQVQKRSLNVEKTCFQGSASKQEISRSHVCFMSPRLGEQAIYYKDWSSQISRCSGVSCVIFIPT